MAIKLHLHTRLWVLQEQVLSCRILTFGDSLQWNCSCGKDLSEWDPFPSEQRLVESHESSLQGWIAKKSAEEPYIKEEYSTAKSPRFPFQECCGLIQAHSMRAASDITDLLPAIAGVATIVNRFYNQVYLAG